MGMYIGLGGDTHRTNGIPGRALPKIQGHRRVLANPSNAIAKYFG